MGLAFQRPELLWVLPALLAGLVLWRFFRRPLFAAVGIPALLTAPVYRASPLRRAPFALACLAVATIVLAVADPVVPFAEQRIASRGLDIALVLDLSTSMQEAMSTAANAISKPSRLNVTKRALSEFIARRPDDRIGLLVFSDNAYVLSALTLDHASLQHQVAMIDANTLQGEGMTAIGEGVALGSALLAKQAPAGERRDRVLVVLTDGENTAGREPVAIVSKALDDGNQVYLVGVDLEDEIKRRPEVVRLIRTVERRGGRYFSADDAGQLAEAARGIDSLERGVLVTKTYVRDIPAFEAFAATALVLLSTAFVLRAVPFFVDIT